MSSILAPQSPEAETAPVTSATSPQVALLPSALTAAISMGRFLARHPQFSTLGILKWRPCPSGEVLVSLPVDHADAPWLVQALQAALEFSGPDLTLYTSPKTHLPMVSLTVRGKYDGARWRIEAQVTVDAYAAAVRQDMAGVR